MGKSVICNYEVQVENPITERLHLFGAMRYTEARDRLLDEAQALGASTGYIWPQTRLATRKLNNIPWVTNRHGIDYLQFNITVNTPERKVYTTSGMSVDDIDNS